MQRPLFHRSSALRTLGILFLVLSIGLATRAQAVDVSEVVFETPMTIINRAELTVVRARIASGQEPQATAYRRLLADAEQAQNFTPEPPGHLRVMGGYQRNSNLNDVRALMERESNATYASALAWLYSGEKLYAEKAAEVLEAWTRVGTSFSGMDRGLQLGSWFNRMLYAADLLRGYEGWSPERAAAFEDWWRSEVLPDVRRIARRRVNNWQEAGVLGILTAAVVFEDRDLLDEGLARLDSYFLPRRRPADNRPHRWRGPGGVARMSGRVPGQGPNWKFVQDERGVYLPHEVSRSGGLRGITYTAYSLTSLVQAMEIARYTGHDWWQRAAPNGATLAEAIATYFRWNELEENFPWHDAPHRSSIRKNPYEIANNHFPGHIEGLAEWLKENRPVDGRQGDPYVTLNRGGIRASSDY